MAKDNILFFVVLILSILLTTVGSWLYGGVLYTIGFPLVVGILIYGFIVGIRKLSE